LSCNQRRIMKFEEIQDIEDLKFKRLTGVKRRTFSKIVGILGESIKNRKAKSGRKKKLDIENCLLMTLEYLREYRTYFHIGQNYGVSESTAYKIIKWVEETLIQHPDFSLAGRKSLEENNNYEVVMIDATETPIERPKKSRKTFTRARKKGTQ
jgi:hypothetical protein